MSDPINPDYYQRGSLESITVIEAFVADKPYRWAPLKYLFRAGKKPGQDEVQDLRKAIWWIEREIATIEATRTQAVVEVERRYRQRTLKDHVAAVADRWTL